MKLRVYAAAMATAIVLVFALSLSAQSPSPDFEKAKVERNAAMRSGDAKVYGRYTTDNFVVVMPDGSMQSKAERMAIMAKSKPEELGPSKDEKAIVVGDTIILNWISSIQGKDARFTEVWVKQSGSWKVAAAHVSMMVPKR